MRSLTTKEDGINRSAERVKKNGEVFTPDSLLDVMAPMVDESVWKDASKTFLDPTAGNGNILCYMLRKRLSYGISKKDAISTLYGVELMEDNVALARKRLRDILETDEFNDIIEHNVVCSDLFKWDLENWCPKKEYEQSSLELFFS